MNTVRLSKDSKAEDLNCDQCQCHLLAHNSIMNTLLGVLQCVCACFFFWTHKNNWTHVLILAEYSPCSFILLLRSLVLITIICQYEIKLNSYQLLFTIIQFIAINHDSSMNIECLNYVCIFIDNILMFRPNQMSYLFDI